MVVKLNVMFVLLQRIENTMIAKNSDVSDGLYFMGHSERFSTGSDQEWNSIK